ncbi:helix-turn-helix transcriptional regulator [Reinekea sp.]|uniref:helix-turn-helix domain-containing protein n=1 Tax=Reinekea sp. TaxID=1970455 RepID=UPI002A831040|nr:helix-turn-helix transcriptional regulator [Reinekea sp.]
MMLHSHLSPEEMSDPSATFAARLRILVAESTVSAFARKVGLSESLIRKYLKGSEPSLSRADQIARTVNVSLEWLATGCGYQYRQAEVVDQAALQAASRITQQCLIAEAVDLADPARLTLLVSIYQFLRAHKKLDGYLDEPGAEHFAGHALASIQGAESAPRADRL